jgi:phospholipid/cholesterol/gamma-HCH transport system substrate-binding protein
MAMESDKHFLLEGIFVLVLMAGAAFAFVWMSKSGHRDDVLYRITFNESVSGLKPGEPVKYHGVDVGVTKALSLDPQDPRRVVVDVTLNNGTPVKTDTRAQLKLKGITGLVYIELTGGNPQAELLAAATPQGQVPVIPSDKSELASLLDRLPKVLEQFGAIGAQTQSVLKDVGVVAKNAKVASENVKQTTEEIKEDPSRLIWKKKKEKEKEK